MTIHIADIALWQGDLTPDAVHAAGFRAINVKVSHGLTQKSVHPKAHEWLTDARFQRCTFHWLVGSASGADQAQYAYSQIASLAECAHVVDVEETKTVVTEQIYRDYVTTIHRLLGRPIITYTGDWWQASHTWLKASVDSPWLMAAPNAGYLDAYPGDSSPHWISGYGGWANLDIMQYRVAPISGIDVSQSAIRDETLWAEMRGASVASRRLPAILALFDEFNKAFPQRAKTSDGIEGDAAHNLTSSDHNRDESGKTPLEDADTIDEAHAADVTAKLNYAGWTMQRCLDIIVARCKSGKEKRIRNIIFNKRIISASWNWSEWRPYDGPNPHTLHAHLGFYYGSGDGVSNPENITTPYGILAAIEEENDLMAELTPEKMNELANIIAKKVYTWDPGMVDPKNLDGERKDGGISDRTLATRGNGTIGMGTALSLLLDRQQVHAASDRGSAASLLSAVQSASGVPADVLAAALVGPLSTALLAGLEARGVGGDVTADEIRDAVADVLTGSTIVANTNEKG